ncbi:MAG: Xaa-Pro peptidase family protein [Eubacteriales bacterium]|nr:Xaa-Pro peptidase family protein [Eubacteriales bacterium]MDD4421727.1 Xaa-Pro peptidase family protein [Eubacteriales bacterium]
MESVILSKQETRTRIDKIITAMNEYHPDWDTVIIVSRVNQYYFLGTMQDGILFIEKNGNVSCFVKRSYERAIDESPLASDGVIRQMDSYRDAAAVIGEYRGNTYVESEVMTLSLLGRLKKHFRFDRIDSVDKTVFSVRAVKSDYEISVLEEAGRRHDDFLLNVVPTLLFEGISEAEFVGELYSELMKRGHQGLTRFSMFQTEMGIGQVAFGENSLYPTSFDGPGGSRGMNAAVPIIGSYNRKLKKGDSVFVDAAFGILGYHSDKTQVFVYGGKPPQEAVKAHNLCMELQNTLASRLITGAIPSEIYRTVMQELDESEKENLGGYKDRKVRFFGHGIGLQVDEYPVIAEGFDSPLEANMVIALEPKKGIAGFGVVGVEDTYVVTANGGRCITGGAREIVEI